MERYEPIKVLGEGSFGKVYLMRDKVARKLVCVKIIRIKNIPKKERESCRMEVELMRRLRHPNIVGYIESFLSKTKDNLCIVMEYCDGGDLASQIKGAKGSLFSESKILHWFVQIVLGLHYMHNNRILHRDLKTQNVFLLRNGRLVLGDLGISKVLDGTMDFAQTCIGTPYYMSPEIFKNKPYNQKSDIWALGCVLYEMATLNHAFDSSSLNGLASKIIKGKYPPIDGRFSENLRGLVADMLATSPQQRPDLDQIMKRGFIQKYIVSFFRDVASRPASDDGFGDGTLAIRIISGAEPSTSSNPDLAALQSQLENLGLNSLIRRAMETDILTSVPAAIQRNLSKPTAVQLPPTIVESVSDAKKLAREQVRALHREEEHKQIVETALAKLRHERETRNNVRNAAKFGKAGQMQPKQSPRIPVVDVVQGNRRRSVGSDVGGVNVNNNPLNPVRVMVPTPSVPIISPPGRALAPNPSVAIDLKLLKKQEVSRAAVLRQKGSSPEGVLQVKLQSNEEIAKRSVLSEALDEGKRKVSELDEWERRFQPLERPKQAVDDSDGKKRRSDMVLNIREKLDDVQQRVQEIRQRNGPLQPVNSKQVLITNNKPLVPPLAIQGQASSPRIEPPTSHRSNSDGSLPSARDKVIEKRRTDRAYDEAMQLEALRVAEQDVRKMREVATNRKRVQLSGNIFSIEQAAQQSSVVTAKTVVSDDKKSEVQPKRVESMKVNEMQDKLVGMKIQSRFNNNNNTDDDDDDKNNVNDSVVEELFGDDDDVLMHDDDDDVKEVDDVILQQEEILKEELNVATNRLDHLRRSLAETKSFIQTKVIVQKSIVLEKPVIKQEQEEEEEEEEEEEIPVTIDDDYEDDDNDDDVSLSSSKIVENSSCADVKSPIKTTFDDDDDYEDDLDDDDEIVIVKDCDVRIREQCLKRNDDKKTNQSSQSQQQNNNKRRGEEEDLDSSNCVTRRMHAIEHFPQKPVISEPITKQQQVPTGQSGRLSDRISSLRQRCVEGLGLVKFNKVHFFLSSQQQQQEEQEDNQEDDFDDDDDVNERVMMKKLCEIVGKDKVHFTPLIEQLIFMEQANT